jgi:hypothetical protein
MEAVDQPAEVRSERLSESLRLAKRPAPQASEKAGEEPPSSAMRGSSKVGETDNTHAEER